MDNNFAYTVEVPDMAVQARRDRAACVRFAAAYEGTVTFQAPDPFQGQKETWTLFCETPEGTVRSARQVFVARGERRALDLRGDCRVRL